MKNPRFLISLLALLVLGVVIGFSILARRPAINRVAQPASSATSAPVAAAPIPPALTPGFAPTVPLSTTRAARYIPIVDPLPAYPGAHHVPSKAEEPVPGAPPPLPIPPDFLEKMVDSTGKIATFALPGGLTASGSVELVQHDAAGNLSLVQGRLSAPRPGFFFFNKEALPGVAGAFSGNVRFDNQVLAYRAEPSGPGGASMLVPRRIDQVMCLGLPRVGATQDGSSIQNAPQTYPTNIPIPGYNNNVIPLQSLPGAKGVIYLDFNGGPGPWIGWGNFVALPSGSNNAQIKDVWQRVAEDYQGFNVNITTDLGVFNKAAPNSRQHVMITSTNTAAPGAGGVAFENSFDTSADEVNWAFYTSGKDSAEVVSHEVGHTLGLSHMGQNINGVHSEYYTGRGTGDVGWAPIMGAGYYDNLTQFSKGDYQNPSNTEDQLLIISNNNNSVAYRSDDDGATFATANYLEILNDNTVSNEGIIERTGDVDAYRFSVTASSTVSFTVNPVNASPNLDIVASIYKSDDTTLIASANPATNLYATVTATLPAGDYTLQVSPTGYGDPLNTGYSNYGVLGAYLITGSVTNGVKPARFSLAENSPNATAVGSVTPRNNHGSNALTYAISSGNTGAPFAINASTGAITVATSSKLNFEAYSTRWDVPAVIPMFVTITDAANPTLNETIRVVVTLTNVNEAPTITGGSATIFAHTQVGTPILTVTGSDQDQFDFPTFSIASGNTPNNAFVINPVTGAISVAADITVNTSTVYALTVLATDQGTPALSTPTTVPITVLPLSAAYSPGTIARAFYENINGNNVSDLTGNANFPSNPDSEQYLPSSDGLAHGNNYGSVMRGFVIPPATGSYTFWIASDDSGELRISPDATQAKAVVRASNATYTGQNVYNNFASQQSPVLTLTAGQPYYIEARHKQGNGGDHLSVAWQGPGISQQVIPGLYLAPFYQNYVPKIAAMFNVRRDAYNGSAIGTVPVTDLNPGDAHGSFAITGGTGSTRFTIDPTTGSVRLGNGAALPAGGTYTLTVSTTDSGAPALTGSGTVTINVIEPNVINIASGSIAQQIWTNMPGNNVANLTSDARYPYSPTTTRLLTTFAGPPGLGDNYGTRIRALVTPATTGSYNFYIASDDSSSLLFNPNSSGAAGATQIASVNGYTASGVFTTQPSQTSAAFTLTAGQSYYLEALQKQGNGGDFVQVAWTGPNITPPTIIPGSVLTPYNVNAPPVSEPGSYVFPLRPNSSVGTAVGTIVATDPEGDSVTYAILTGNGTGAFAINAVTGAITVANSAAISPGQTMNLNCGAQDGGIGGVYPLATTAISVSIVIPKLVDQWRQDHFGANAANAAIAGNLADPDGDGLNNLLEYALGTNPLASNVSTVVSDIETISGQKYLRLTITKNPGATDVIYSAEATGDPLTPASWSSSGVVVETNSATTLTARDSVPVSGAPTGRFMRLRVSLQ